MVNLGLVNLALEEIAGFGIAAGIGATLWTFGLLPGLSVPCNIFPLFCGSGLYFFITVPGTLGVVITSSYILVTNQRMNRSRTR